MDKLSMAIIAMEAHVACSNDRLRQAWDIIHAKLVEENGFSHNKQSAPCDHKNYVHGESSTGETICFGCGKLL